MLCLIDLTKIVTNKLPNKYFKKYFRKKIKKMKPIKFEQCNKHMDFPNNESLDFFQDELSGKVIMLWQFDEEERQRIAETGQLFISQVLGQTAVPMLDVPFREVTEEERVQIEKQRKQVRMLQERARRSSQPNAKRVKLKAVK